MTRKDYVNIAAALKAALCGTMCAEDLKSAEPDAFHALFDCVTGNIADVLAADNHRFDREKFLRACGMPE